MTELRDYLRGKGVSMKAFGQRIGKSKSVVSRICARNITVSHETARRIFEETGGAVTPNDLFGIDPVPVSHDAVPASEGQPDAA